jgi:hypothetical protein
VASAYGWVTILLYCLWLNEHTYYFLTVSTQEVGLFTPIIKKEQPFVGLMVIGLRLKICTNGFILIGHMHVRYHFVLEIFLLSIFSIMMYIRE